jgi:putative ABC transport system permease protein
VGDTFESSHGLTAASGEDHDEAPIRIVGVFAETGTVVDQLILTSIETIWHVHGIEHGHDTQHGNGSEHGEEQESSAPSPQGPAPEYTAFLISYSSPMAAAVFPRWVNTETSLQAAAPAYETSRLFNMLGVGFDALRVFGVVLILAALLAVFVALVNALKERRYDLAMMRTLGASRFRLMSHVLLEGQLLAGMGVVLGLILGHSAAAFMASAVQESRGMALDGLAFVSGEGWIILLAMGAGLIASLIPAFQAYRTDISSTLAEG